MTFKNRSIAGTLAMLATVVTVAAATPVRAETVSVPVAYGDLDLSTQAGAAALKSRIARAADRVCGANEGANRLAAASCRAKAIAGANVQVAQREAPAFQLAVR